MSEPLQPVRLQPDPLGVCWQLSRETEASEFRYLQDFRHRRGREQLQTLRLDALDQHAFIIQQARGEISQGV